MRVFLLEDHELPLVRGVALVRTGNLFDPPDKKGLSQVMADVLRSGGTKSKTGDQIDEQLENLGGSVESGMDESSASMSFSALKESADTVLADFQGSDDRAGIPPGQNRSGAVAVPQRDRAAQ